MYIKKYKLEVILFIVNAIYMILELIAQRILSPYFGSTNLVWTSVIGVILLSTSVGNYLGGIIADKSKEDSLKLEKNICINIMISGLLVLMIPIMQRFFITTIVRLVSDVKIGAVGATLILFFLPSMFIGMLSPIIIKLKMNKLENVGKTSGKIYAIATLGSIIGTFAGGFILVPNFGSNEILFVLSSIIFLQLFLLLENMAIKQKIQLTLIVVGMIIINIICFYNFYQQNLKNGEKVKIGNVGVYVNYDTQYGKVTIYNTDNNRGKIRHLNIDKGHESATYIENDKIYELVYEYTKYYDLMFKSSNQIKDVLMIGGAGYSYPKYYISHFENKNMDVVEIDEKVTQIANEYFYLDKLVSDFNLKQNQRLRFITQDGRIYLNSNTKKYDAILNDSFSGDTPAKTLTTIEAVEKIYNSLNSNGVYLTNIISALEGEDSKFIKAEVKTLKNYFKNVYVVPCNYKNDRNIVQNNMVVATDDTINLEGNVNIDYSGTRLITDNYCPIDTLIPRI